MKFRLTTLFILAATVVLSVAPGCQQPAYAATPNKLERPMDLPPSKAAPRLVLSIGNRADSLFSLKQTSTTVTSSPTPGSPFGYTGYVDKHGLAGVGSYRITTFNSLFGNPKLSVDVLGLTGFEVRNQAAIVGGMLSKSGNLALNAKWLVGLGYATVTGQKGCLGACLGISGTF